jgi:hypothetical protein
VLFDKLLPSPRFVEAATPHLHDYAEAIAAAAAASGVSGAACFLDYPSFHSYFELLFPQWPSSSQKMLWALPSYHSCLRKWA